MAEVYGSEFKITEGPGKWDLAISMFEETKYLVFTLKPAEPGRSAKKCFSLHSITKKGQNEFELILLTYENEEWPFQEDNCSGVLFLKSTYDVRTRKGKMQKIKLK